MIAEGAPAGGGTEAGRLRRWINVCGAIVLVAHLLQSILSYVQVVSLWREEGPRVLAFFEDIFGDLQATWLHVLLFEKRAVILSHWIPLAVASLAALALVLILRRHAARLDEGAERAMLRWSLAFGVACFFAYPVFTQDLWLSAVWGRMIVANVNPYHHLFTPEALAGFPLDHFPMVMSYGPGWAIISAAVMAMSGSGVVVAGVLFKAVVAAAWIWSLYLIRAIMAERTPLERALALAAFGWVPLAVLQSVAEAHNDVVMGAFLLLWFLLLLRGRATAPLALMASALTKYVTAPLFLLDIIHAVRRERLSWRGYVLRMIAPALYGIAVVGLFFRSPQFFDGVRMVNDWHFLQPHHALIAIEYTLGIDLDPVAWAIAVFFPAIAAVRLGAALIEPTPERLAKAMLAIMATILFTVSAHVWPWYVMWILIPAVLVPHWWLARFSIGVAFMAPFMAGSWWIAPFEDHFGGTAFALYLGAIVWAVLTRPPAPRRAFP